MAFVISHPIMKAQVRMEPGGRALDTSGMAETPPGSSGTTEMVVADSSRFAPAISLLLQFERTLNPTKQNLKRASLSSADAQAEQDGATATEYPAMDVRPERRGS